jgi:peptidoglycan/xylan/chitin deacetylase (PgdA/CDA1 family)
VSRPQILVSFDLEEFDVPEEYGQVLDDAEKLRVGCEGLDAVLAMLDRLDIPATFFITAHFAENFPDRLRHMAKRYEIASHGYYHGRFELDDLTSSRQVLRQITGQPIAGFRMARLQPVSEGAIVAAGYRYNSSMNPTYLPGRYNHFFQPRLAYRSGALLNIPVSVTPLIRFPLFWLSFKNLPLWLYKLLSAWNIQTDRQLNLYFHPWEFANIQSYQLPQYIRQPCGPALITKLEKYLRWLDRQGKLITFSQFEQNKY